MNYPRRIIAPAQRVTFLHEIFDLGAFRRRRAQKLRLHIQAPVKFQVRFMNQHRSAGGSAQPGQTAHVIDMRVRADNRPHFQFVGR